jgi:hypothetical protein
MLPHPNVVTVEIPLTVVVALTCWGDRDHMLEYLHDAFEAGPFEYLSAKEDIRLALAQKRFWSTPAYVH